MNRKALCALAASILLLASCASSVNDPDISISQNETLTYSVKLPTGQAGYSVVGEKNVKKGQNYSFYVAVKEGYDASKMAVSANGLALSSTSSTYVVSNVQGDLTIEVSGVVAGPSLELGKSCYRFYLGRIDESSKKKDYFLVGAKGSYGGASCEVDVDISDVDFANQGTYDIVYTLVGHDDVSKKGKVIILPNPDQIDDISIDISSIYEQEIVSQEIYGEANVDFTLSNGDYLLTSDDVSVSRARGGNFLTKEYLKALGLGEFVFRVSFDAEVYFSFKVSVVDLKGPNYYFPISQEELCFTIGSLSLPNVSSGSDSIQEIGSSYSLGGVAMSKEEIYEEVNNKVGDYDYTVSATYKGAVVGSKTYSVHVRDVMIPFVFSSTGSKNASSNYSNNGNVVLNFDSDDDTNVALSQSYIKEHNAENKKYVFIAFRILSTQKSPSMWYRDPSVCFDEDGNYVPLEKNNKYNGASLGAVGSLSYATFALNGDVFENDVWIMRAFHGSIEVQKITFCDLSYVDPIVEKEATKSRLNDIPSSFGNIWNYFHVGSHGTSGGASLGGDCLDVQSTFSSDMEKVGYKGAKLTLKFDADSQVAKVECWEYGTSNHLSSCDGVLDENKEAVVDLPLTAFSSRVANQNLRFVFNSSMKSGDSYKGSTYINQKNFVLSGISYY